jgi:hypothetical protein
VLPLHIRSAGCKEEALGPLPHTPATSGASHAGERSRVRTPWELEKTTLSGYPLDQAICVFIAHFLLFRDIFQTLIGCLLMFVLCM